MNVDIEQYKMVKEALHERHNLLEIAPHLSFPLPIMLPVYRWWQVKGFAQMLKSISPGAQALHPYFQII